MRAHARQHNQINLTSLTHTDNREINQTCGNKETQTSLLYKSTRTDAIDELDEKAVNGNEVIHAGETQGKVEDKVECDDEATAKFVCVACGNRQDYCHQYIFGTFLVHECITFFEKREPDQVDDALLEHHFKYKYNQHLRFVCHNETKKYDMYSWYKPPECLKRGAFQFALKLVHGQKIYYQIKKNRVEGIAGEKLMNKYTTVYKSEFNSK